MLNQTEYIYRVHCGDKDCYSCAKQHKVCKELELLDNKTDMDTEELDFLVNNNPDDGSWVGR